MRRVSLILHLSVLIFVLIADVTALPLLHWQLVHLGSKSKMLKWAMDITLLSLLTLATLREISDGKQELVQIFQSKGVLSPLNMGYKSRIWTLS